MTLTLTRTDDGAALADSADAFQRDGLCVLDDTLPDRWVQQCRAAALDRVAACLRRAAAGGHDVRVGTDAGWAEIVQRAPGRYDVLHGTGQAPFTDPLAGDRAPWMPLVHRLLGPEARRLYRGLLVAEPGCAEQPWHTDGEHLFPGTGHHLPVHCLNVFVPLVDIGPHNGPTEFCPGSHHLTGALTRSFEQDPSLPRRIGYRGNPVAPGLRAGSVLPTRAPRPAQRHGHRPSGPLPDLRGSLVLRRPQLPRAASLLLTAGARTRHSPPVTKSARWSSERVRCSAPKGGNEMNSRVAGLACDQS